MNEINAYLAISAVLIFIRSIFGGIKDLFFYPICFYFFFAFGPVVNHTLGLPIYFGIPVEYIPHSCRIFTIVISIMIILTSIIPKAKISLNLKNITQLTLLRPILVIFSLYAASQIFNLTFSGANSTKIDKISLLNPRFHYSYLMIQVYLLAFYFFITSKLDKLLYYSNIILYVTYCILSGERDFIFPLASISIHSLIFLKLKRSHKVLLTAGLFSFIILGSFIFLFRDSTQVSDNYLSLVLNQGSLLFINSYTAKLLAESYDFFSGYTYLNSIQNLLPSFIYKTDFNTLDWFKNNYAPLSTSGYGFALDAEGYMNFGTIGVIVTFILITLIQRLTERNFLRNDFAKFYSVFYISFVMYSFRNDSLAFMKGNIYAIIFFCIIYFCSKIVNNIGNDEYNSNT